ncbi:hypothetical protein GCM10010909_01420 [Acidocella aquatica]|uniref:Uncharacterized protein n=1 Tax=Acidocella aquatica TaxID=1922313 RepID=A0ABQ5ZZU6_9PROT|nr:hypothetical protein [Acidocella aquatica]GLR65464.1 hypothetical protein GCM10010909_01420 [Acidocella aquatica]
MILPTAEDMLRTIEGTFDTVIRPTLTGTTERSAAATISHLLRLARLRLEREGQVLYDDIAALRALLTHIRTYLAGIGEAAAVAALDPALEPKPLAEGQYPTLTLAGQQASGLRGALETALARLQEIRDVHGAAADYQQLRAAIRTYMAEQLRRESELIEPAFWGQGPRR